MTSFESMVLTIVANTVNNCVRLEQDSRAQLLARSTASRRLDVEPLTADQARHPVQPRQLELFRLRLRQRGEQGVHASERRDELRDPLGGAVFRYVRGRARPEVAFGRGRQRLRTFERIAQDVVDDPTVVSASPMARLKNRSPKT